MKKHLVHFFVAVLAACSLSLNVAIAQTSSGQISGRAVDASGAVIPGADVKLINQGTGATQVTQTDNSGLFVFPSVQPGTFAISVQAGGFKSFEKRDLHLSASQRLSAGDLKLEVGSASQTVNVEAAVTPVQNESGERSAVLDSKELTSLSTPGRDVLALVRLLPGVVKDGEGASQLGTQGAGSVSGTREVSNSVSVDGVNGNPRGGGNRFDTPLNMEAVSEVKVLLNSYQAEYGQSSGAIVNLITKSGTQMFHGTGYYYGRNEAFNANDTFNNKTGAPRPQSRFNTFGYNIGGPIYWPGKFNSDKNKLFFFFSQEIWPTTQAGTPKFFTMPTSLERQGDFSQSVDSKGNKVTLKDPKNCGPAANSNCLLNSTHINPAFINPNTQALLNVLPLPTLTTPQTAPGGGLYNFFQQAPLKRPVNQQVLRLDYNITDRWHMYFRGMNMSNKQEGPTATGVPSAAAWGIPFFYSTPARNAAINLTFAATPTLVNEFTMGYADWKEKTGTVNPADIAKLQRDKTGVALGMINPANNPLNIVPRATFAGSGGSTISNSPQISFDNRFPFNNNTGNWEGTDGLTKVWGRHTSKVGAYFQKGHYVQHPIGGNFDGQFSFDVNTKNATDSGYAYANALLGNYNSYTEGNRTVYAPKWKILEWYGQDNWKLTPKLTLDYGMRFSYDFPTMLDPGAGVTFVPNRYDPSQVPALYQPILFSSLTTTAQKTACNNNKDGTGKCGQNPNNPADIKPSAAIGQFIAPFNFTGSVINNDPNYPRALRNSNGVLFSPRLGIAFDPTGSGKMAIRAGAGIFYNLREDGGVVGDFATTAPITTATNLSVGNASSFFANCNTSTAGCTGGAGVLSGPQDSKIMPVNHKIASTIAANLGIQRDIGFSTVIDVSYVGTFGRHLEQTPNINAVPYLSQFLPQNIDPTASKQTFLNGTVTQQGAKSDNFFRPIPGYGNISLREYTGTSNYNSLQTSVTRRFARGLQLGVSYTWSKALSYADTTSTGTASATATYQNSRWWDYGLSNVDRTHNMVIHWVYDLPKVNSLWDNKVLKAVADNWEWSGIAEFVSGTPQSINLNTGGINLTGGGDGPRILLVGDPYAPSDQHHTSFQFLNPSAFALPPVGVVPNPSMPGITRAIVFRGPGTNNWDMTLAKNIPFTERVRFQLRCEAYNVFNHVSFTAPTSSAINSATFNATTGQIDLSKSNFGALTSDRGPRTLQLVGRISF